MDQPLSYQTLPSSCWVTSVVNGLLCLFRGKKKIPGFVLRLLHSVLTDDGVHGSGPSKRDWAIVLEAIAQRCNLNIKSFSKEDAEKILDEVDFSESVVICDVGAGTHSILLNFRVDDWFYGFDPDWDHINNPGNLPNEYIIFPKVIGDNIEHEGKVNFKVCKSHLYNKIATENKRFSMGAVSRRNITVISKVSTP